MAVSLGRRNDMTLFDDIKRKDQWRYSDSRFRALNKSPLDSAQRVRDLMGSWFKEYPGNHNDRRDLRARFCDDNDSVHIGAFFELYCYALLAAQGYDMKTRRYSAQRPS